MPRARCAACRRALSGCLCGWLRPTANEVELLLLLHPLELREPKNSAALLALSLARCQVLVGEVFDPARLGPMEGTALLYPGEPAARPAEPAQAQVRRLIVLDATWRKSRKMLHRNPWLQALPRLALSGELPPSRYAGLRRAHAPEQLSTLEAGALALAQLEGAPERYAPLLAGFSGFVAQLQSQARKRGLSRDV